MIPMAQLAAIAAGAGAPLVGATPVSSLPKNREELECLLPGASHVVVVAAPHGRSATASANFKWPSSTPGTPTTRWPRRPTPCPAGALTGAGRVDKKKCGDRVFAGGGFRVWREFLADLAEAPTTERQRLLGSQQSLNLWQNFMTGIYDSCWACQAACPVGQVP